MFNKVQVDEVYKAKHTGALGEITVSQSELQLFRCWKLINMT